MSSQRAGIRGNEKAVLAVDSPRGTGRSQEIRRSEVDHLAQSPYFEKGKSWVLIPVVYPGRRVNNTVLLIF